jgi:hypothetical protein
MFSTRRHKPIVKPHRAGLRLERLEDRRLLNRSTDWISFAHDPQHTGLSFVASQSIDQIHWQVKMDLNFNLSTHEGSPVITQANTVIVPIKNNSSYSIEGHRGNDGTLLWSAKTEYSGSVFAPVLTLSNRLYFPGPGGTVYYIDNPDDPGATISGQLAFYGIANHDANLDSHVEINTPLSVGGDGTIYFGFTASSGNDLNLKSGLARMDVTGNGNWIAASDAAGDSSISKVAKMCAPALSRDGSMVYVGVNNTSSQGYLVVVDSATLKPINKVQLKDVSSGNLKVVWDGSSATPMVGPDGDVYYGIEEDPYGSNLYRGWMTHFSGDLSVTKIPGAFGWDNTPSVVPRSMVPSYTGPSSYLIVTKYNKYAINVYEIGILDPNTAMDDPYSHVPVMQDVQTVDAVTNYEWCINDMAVDLSTDSILANSEDGHLYRWDLTSNSLNQSVTLDNGAYEAYTPTLIGPDGTVYSVNDGILFAVGAKPSAPESPGVMAVLSSASQDTGNAVGTLSAVVLPNVLGGDAVDALAMVDGQGSPGTLGQDSSSYTPLAAKVEDPFEVQDLLG